MDFVFIKPRFVAWKRALIYMAPFDGLMAKGGGTASKAGIPREQFPRSIFVTFSPTLPTRATS